MFVIVKLIIGNICHLNWLSIKIRWDVVHR